MDLIPWNLAIPLITVALPALARAIALIVTSMTATFAREEERRRAARKALDILLGRNQGGQQTDLG